MKKVYGNTKGLKANQVHRLENFYRRRIPPENIVTYEIARDLASISLEIRRQVGLLVDRSGRVVRVVTGDFHGLVIPDVREYRAAPGRLRGIRLVHTHLRGEGLSEEDLTDLALLRLDLMAAILLDQNGLPESVIAAHVIPRGSDETPCRVLEPLPPRELRIGCREMIRALENEMAQAQPVVRMEKGKERALLVSVTTASKTDAQNSMAELKELARSSGIQVLSTVIQHRDRVDSRFLMGKGKLREVFFRALRQGATLIVFDQELNPSQIRSITDMVELKVIDRTQLILDIFAQRAHTREGKLQVELAQLKYLMPRLVVKNTAMSRLTGGIGGRGPGETKLEINRRRVRERIARLEKELDTVKTHRKQQRAKRMRNDLPIISIVGYTNAGKSTLLNTLTKSDLLAESRLFATLDPASRRLRFPRDTEVIITDTVGFIRDLPNDLLVAFRATLEELQSADLLLHMVDAANPRCLDHVASVDKILTELKLDNVPSIHVLNKMDLINAETMQILEKRLGGIFISANDSRTLKPLIEIMETSVVKNQSVYPGFAASAG